MPLPRVTVDDVKSIVPKASDIHFIDKGGQKLVFGCTLADKRYVIKFLLTAEEPSGPDASRDDFGDVEARAKREVETMAACTAPTLVKLGPIGLTAIELRGQKILYFTEERIDGKNLQQILKQAGPLPPAQIARMGKDVNTAVSALWGMAKIHRDIKPSNVMRRDGDGGFVLLDVGLVFDLDDESLTKPGWAVGTPIYFSPEQMHVEKRRLLDFRSDHFALGIVLYEAATRRHPFIPNGESTALIMGNILNLNPPSSRAIRKEIPEGLDEIIMRLLSKPAHLRYRSCAQLAAAIESLNLH